MNIYLLKIEINFSRSRERFIESNNQISALVEKFKLEGGPYRKTNIKDIENKEAMIFSIDSHR